MAEAASVVTVETPTLVITAELSGPEDGSPIILLHGWPDGPRCWDAVRPALHAAGYRTIVPCLRGFGATTFRPGATVSGDLEALGQDVLDLMDGLGLATAVLVGHDWGARAAYVASHAAPERVTACVAISVGWGTNTADQPMPLGQVQNYWYHWFFATPYGAKRLKDDPRGFAHYIWTIWMPDFPFDAATYEATAPVFDNPDWPDVTIHSYSVRWGNAAPNPQYDALRAAQRADMTIRVPTLMLHGEADPVTAAATSDGKGDLFAARYERHVLAGLNHFPPREAPDVVARHILDFLG
ncbi:alpha/beta fold hydrolase [Acuticoccus sediminis]|uniref:alpha/beta fold hydrolase n=1 Tax=Acuticoccus sediminis TaxID=2184697 RepID=UPI00192E39A5|nr:alpha/beta hydrolase [Acuticoccus sediminis]